MIRQRIGIVVLVSLVALRASAGLACTGDCDGDRRVGVEELIRGVTILLQRGAAQPCAGLATANIRELVTAVRHSAHGCT